MDKIIVTLATKFSDLTKSDVQLSVEAIVDAMSAQLIRGGRIELRGFGTFRLNQQLPVVRANAMPEINDLDQDESVVIFKPGSVIRERINNTCKHEHESKTEAMHYPNL